MDVNCTESSTDCAWTGVTPGLIAGRDGTGASPTASGTGPEERFARFGTLSCGFAGAGLDWHVPVTACALDPRSFGARVFSRAQPLANGTCTFHIAFTSFESLLSNSRRSAG